MAISILNQALFDRNTTVSSYVVTGFNVPSGTSRLLIQMEYRSAVSIGPTVSTVTHNGDTVNSLLDNSAIGAEDINTYWGERQNPDIGTFDINITFPDVAKGLKIWVLAIDGEKSSGSILGVADHHRNDSPATDTVGLGVTPSAGSLLLASLAISANTTLVSFIGTGFVEVTPGGAGGSNNYTTSSGMTSTSRYRLNAPASLVTVSATFAVTDIDIGGSLIEILAEATASVDVSGDIAFGLSITGTAGVEGVSSARIADGSYRSGKFSWTEIIMLQPDLAGVDRRIITIGPAAAPNYTLDMAVTGAAAANVYRWGYRLTDGFVTVETGPGTQSTAAHVIALVHQPGNPVTYVNGIESVSSRAGQLRIGALDLGAGGLALGSHDQASPAAYTGLIGRYAVYEGAMTADQLRLLTLSLMDPDSIWGYGSENDFQVVNRSPVALPMLVEPDGRPSMTIAPRMVDLDGSVPTISFATQGAHTTVAISGGTQLVLNFEAGWQGKDSFTYTASDASKSSVGKISIDQRRPALLARNDAVTVTAGSSLLFDPRLNDIGAGVLRVTAVTQPSAGTAFIQTDGRILYTPGA